MANPRRRIAVHASRESAFAGSSKYASGVVCSERKLPTDGGPPAPKAAADVRVEHHNAQPRVRSLARDSAELFQPHPVLGTRAARVAGVDVPVAEAGVHANRDVATVAGSVQVTNHARRSTVRENPML